MSLSNFRNIFNCYRWYIRYSGYSLLKNVFHASTKLSLLKIRIHSNDFTTCTKDLIGYKHPTYKYTLPKYVIGGSFILTWLGFGEEETKEDEMIVAIKRSILCIQRNELPKAEQMLHIALRLAQQKQSTLGITYIHDIMANLALERGELKKAEILFVNVMQQILMQGTAEDDLKMLHISLKLARIYYLGNDMAKAQQGFEWSMNGLNKHIAKNENPDDNLLELWGLGKYWYAQFLLKQQKYSEAKEELLSSYNVYVKLHGSNTEHTIILLNDLGAVHKEIGELNKAELYLREAIKIGKEMPDMEDLGSVYANLGMVFIEQGLYNEAKTACSRAWKMGRKNKALEIENQASYCLDQLKKKFQK